VYFRAMAYCIGLALAAHVLGLERGSFAARAQSFNLLSALGLVLANMLLLEPKATKVMSCPIRVIYRAVRCKSSFFSCSRFLPR
jgi:ethanolamine transporter EutH